MAFLREKKINGQSYFYLVKTARENGKVRQKVLKYIGKKENLSKLLEEVHDDK